MRSMDHDIYLSLVRLCHEAVGSGLGYRWILLQCDLEAYRVREQMVAEFVRLTGGAGRAVPR